MVRGTSVCKNGLRKGAWSEEEDNKLRAYILRYGHWNWQQLPKFAGLARCGKSCRLRWLNYLKPGLKKGSYSKEEEEMIIKLHQEIGNKWSVIAGKLSGRTDNEIKNYWHTRLKKLKKQDPNSIEKNEITSKNIHVMDQKDQDSSMSSLVSTSHSQISSPTTYSSTILGLEDLVTENGSNDLIISPSTSCNSILIDSEESTFSSFWNEPMFSNASNGLNSPSTSGTNSSEVCTDEFMSGFWDEPFSMDTSYNMSYSILGPSFWDYTPQSLHMN